MASKTDIRIQKIGEAMEEARKFIKRGNDLIERLLSDKWAEYQCKESAALKRTSMDLTRALAEYRKS